MATRKSAAKGWLSGKARIGQYRLVYGITAKRPPLLLNIRLGEPFDIGKSTFHVVGIGNDGNSLSAECRGRNFFLGVDEEPDLVAADFLVLVEAGKKANQFIAIATCPDLNASRLSPI